MPWTVWADTVAQQDKRALNWGIRIMIKGSKAACLLVESDNSYFQVPFAHMHPVLQLCSILRILDELVDLIYHS